MDRRRIEIVTGAGRCPAALFPAEGGGRSGVILYMDAFGPRDSLHGMAARLAAAGYSVLLPDLFYRAGPYGPYDARTAFGNEATRAELMAMIQATTQAITVADTAAFLQALADAGADGPIGTVGYCMGGARALSAAAAYPERIVAAASFHGGNLASDAEDSPHRAAARMRARVYVGCAGEDRSFPPEQSGRLAQALREGGVDHVIENYVGMAHGWCVPDHSVYDPAGAERHWRRLLTFYAETLG